MHPALIIQQSGKPWPLKAHKSSAVSVQVSQLAAKADQADHFTRSTAWQGSKTSDGRSDETKVYSISQSSKFSCISQHDKPAGR
jgi:hypothetical protein